MANKILRLLIISSLVSINIDRSLTVVDGEMTEVETSVDTDETEVEIVETLSYDDVISALKDEIHETRNWEENCYDDTLQISYEDAQVLLRIAASEAADQGTLGMFYVMQTVMNRVASPDYPDSVAEVVFQDYQFQPVQNGTYYTVEIPAEAHEALAMLESNKQPNSEIVAFEATWNDQSLLKYYDILFTHKGHTFYKKKQKK